MSTRRGTEVYSLSGAIRKTKVPGLLVLSCMFASFGLLRHVESSICPESNCSAMSGRLPACATEPLPTQDLRKLRTAPKNKLLQITQLTHATGRVLKYICKIRPIYEMTSAFPIEELCHELNINSKWANICELAP